MTSRPAAKEVIDRSRGRDEEIKSTDGNRHAYKCPFLQSSARFGNEVAKNDAYGHSQEDP